MKFIILVINKLKIGEFYMGKMSQTFYLKINLNTSVTYTVIRIRVYSYSGCPHLDYIKIRVFNTRVFYTVIRVFLRLLVYLIPAK